LKKVYKKGWIVIKPTIFVLGTDHLSNQNNGNMFMAQTKGVLTNKRQSEMSELINLLKDFKPTKVALEVLNENEVGLNQDYFSYQKGDFVLSSNEIHQIGFQLANKCNLDKVNAVDWNDDLKDVPDLGELAGNNESKFYNQAIKIGNEITSQSEEYYQHHSIKEYLLWLNEKENIAKGQEMYMKLALVESENDPTGANGQLNIGTIEIC